MHDAEAWVWTDDEPDGGDFAAPLADCDALDAAMLRERLRAGVDLSPEARADIQQRALHWVQQLRREPEVSRFDAFVQEYALSSAEGVLLMGLAEALLRIPDEATAEQLIADKLAKADWAAHLGRGDAFVRASTWGLLLGKRVLASANAPGTLADGELGAALQRLVGRVGEPLVRAAIRKAMRMMGAHFVVGRDIGEALQAAIATRAPHSFDMLGEEALSSVDAQHYFDAYAAAIVAVGAGVNPDAPLHARHSISVKLSALHPRYSVAQQARVQRELVPRLRELARLARERGIGLTVDAEEADRLELSLAVFAAVYADTALANWDGFGLALQAYQRRAPAVLDGLDALVRRVGRSLPLRLVKGAYWDTEIKRAQEQGLGRYPVFTRKRDTELCYLACAQRLLAARPRFYPMFATHNAQTLASVLALAGDAGHHDFEVQRLHGMGEALHEQLVTETGVTSRVYAPVGSHRELLPYLVRRLLENGANSSFVHQLFDTRIAAAQLVIDPLDDSAAARVESGVPPPALLYAPQRRNSQGLDLADRAALAELAAELAQADREAPRTVQALVADTLPEETSTLHELRNPADRTQLLGRWQPTDLRALDAIFASAAAAQFEWNARGADARAALLEVASDALEAARPRFMRLLVREAGKTLADALAELREATDLLRYYAATARRLMATPQVLPGPTGEHNELQLHGRGVYACIAPWNFPLAIFGGQIAAALVAGNAVVAKPAEQTPLIAAAFVELLHEAGVPRAVLQLVFGAGELGAALCAAPALAGMAFTGSFEVAQKIQRSLASRPGPLVPLLAETGGLNAMIVDSSALPEQVVRDVLRSAFGSAGQRCSALRVLYLQDEIADAVLDKLRGALAELVLGDPAVLVTDIGPLIDADAQARLAAHLQRLTGVGRELARAALEARLAEQGTFFAPRVIEVPTLADVGDEAFGPLLHVIRYASDALDAVVDGINASGYGLTLGVHTRIEARWQRVQARARVGNCYVNRGMTGAVVGTQPFGGEGLSGTGPKAGGPHYLLRFVTERALCVNTAAVGGNASLLTQTR